MDEQEKSLRERLNGMFSRYNYVGIKNILSTPFEWTIALEQNEIINMGDADATNEDEWVKKKSGTFLPGDGVVKGKTKIVTYKLEPGEKKMVIGEAAYVLIDKIFTLYIKEKYVPQPQPGELPKPQDLALRKVGHAKLRNPAEQDKIIPLILTGPIIKNVDGALQTFVNSKMNEIEGGFSDVQVNPPEEARRGRPPKTATA
jgi:hypothetical protein